MKLPFRSIVKSLTGISTPVFGVTWSPPSLELDIASALLTYLEDRRALYNLPTIEEPEWMLESIRQIRDRLNQDLGKIDRDSELAPLLRGMRSTCREFLDKIQLMRLSYPLYRPLPMMHQQPFFIALGNFRGRFGIYLAQLYVRYGLDVGGDLAAILPSPEEDGSPPTGS